MEVDPSGPTVEVAVKLAFTKDEKSRLEQEHRMYSLLHSKGVQGIPCNIGLFVANDHLCGEIGPYALVMTHAGLSLFGRDRGKNASHSIKQVLHFDSVSDKSDRDHRDSLLATLMSIHRAGVLHGDIRLPNLCATPSEDAFIVDFSHATESSSRKAKANEVEELRQILGIDRGNANAKPVVEGTVEEPGLRRSAWIKEQKRKAKVVRQLKAPRHA
jgi:hypothetical protein